MTRFRALAAAACALTLGAGTLVVTLTIDPEYEAKATAILRPLLGADDLAAALRTRDVHVRLKFSDEAPYLPNPRIPFATITGRTAERVGAESADSVESAVTITDTAFEPVFPAFKDPVRTLKVAAVSGDAARAADIANVFLAEYVAYRRRWYERTLANAARSMRTLIEERRNGRSLVPGGYPFAEEALEAIGLTSRLERRAIGAVRPAAVPGDQVSPQRARDVIVAVLIGALIGWLGAPWLARRLARRNEDRGRG